MCIVPASTAYIGTSGAISYRDGWGGSHEQKQSKKKGCKRCVG